MLPRSHTAVLERNVEIRSELWTEPYEAAWAGEARWFLNVVDASPGTSVEIATFLSPDGLCWCPHESSRLHFEGVGLQTLRVPDFCPWLRLNVEVGGASPYIKTIIYLSLRQ